jgi:SAM-dependent methyltransferase
MRLLSRRKPRPPEPASTARPADAVTLRFTGSCSREAFEATCRQHDCWYHSFYFDNGFAQRGDYDIGRDIAGYGLPEDLRGWTVLDVGTGSGWFAVYFEQRGADVTTVDVRGHCDFDLYGRDRNPPIESEKDAPDRILPDGKPVYYSPFSKGYWLMKEMLGLKSEYVNARAYDICPELFGGRRFDLVFMGSILMHLRDPIGALMAAHTVCDRQLIATSYVEPSRPHDAPSMTMFPGKVGNVGWWKPNQQCLKQWLHAAGFTRVELEPGVRLTADVPYYNEQGETHTLDQTHWLVRAWV